MPGKASKPSPKDDKYDAKQRSRVCQRMAHEAGLNFLSRAWRSRVSGPFWAYLREQADNPSCLGRSAALGFSIGLCPVFGVSTAVTLLLVVIARQCHPTALHGPMALLANLVSLPFEVLVLLPYLRLGELVTGSPHLQLSAGGVADLLRRHPWQALDILAHAVLGWALSFPLQVVALAMVLTPLIGCIQTRMRLHRQATSAATMEGLLGRAREGPEAHTDDAKS